MPGSRINSQNKVLSLKLNCWFSLLGEFVVSCMLIKNSAFYEQPLDTNTEKNSHAVGDIYPSFQFKVKSCEAFLTFYTIWKFFRLF